MFGRNQLIALLTDFGTNDGYAAVLKAVILRYAAKTEIIDITHQVLPQAITSASYLLFSVFDFFPPQTIFLCIVDPGVGTERKMLLLESANKYVIAPDNGLISLLVRFKSDFRSFILKTDFVTSTVSSTFHGRDLFAPAVGLLAKGKKRKILGPSFKPLILPHLFTQKDKEGTIEGHIIHFDRFGNAISSIHKNDLESNPEKLNLEFFARNALVKEPFKLRLQGLKKTYAEVACGQPLAYLGSSGFVEIAIRNGNAKNRFQLSLNSKIKIWSG